MRRVHILAAVALSCLLCPACGGTNPAMKGDLAAHGHLLGTQRGTVETHLRPAGDADADGWVPYATGLRVRYIEGSAAALSQPVPGDLNCTEAARWAGFSGAQAPILRGRRCIWPQDDVVHALGVDVAGTLDLDTRVLEVRVVK